MTRVTRRVIDASANWVTNATVGVNLNVTVNDYFHQIGFRPLAHMPGPHNAKKKKRAQQRKKHRTNSKTHSSTSSTITQTTQSTVSDLSSPTLVTSLTSPASDVHGTENLRKDYCEGVHWLAQDTPSLPASPYGPIDDPTLLLLSNPIIHDPGNGPRVRNMGAFLNSSFSQPVSTADPLCAEFSRCEILQMLRTVLPEETALVCTFRFPQSGLLLSCDDY